MTPDSPPDVKSIFGRALEIQDAGDRATFLDRACTGVPGLRAELDELLTMHDRAGGFLRRPVAAAAAAGLTATRAPLTEGPGTRVGPYKLLQEIGEGGMGIVFMAEQEEPVRRRVALKIVKPGMDSRQVVARFEAERQALSMMDHPNIAKVFDAGATASGRPYFVMELVHGVPITDYCDANKLSPRERLELFVPVCQAIQHAHQKGVIHRDVKPSNVLVTMYDDKPVPKVIDFGVAKAIEQRLTEKTLFTQYGALVGTFEYMSPEQAEMNALGVDTRSDVYSLGVLLYELLTGSTPLDRERLRDAALGEVIRLIKEEEPPRPSVRLSTGGTLATVAAARKTEPSKLSALIRGELDWIVMRCLEKDRTRRYDTASALGRDVERYLADESVEACPPSVGYRFRKTFRRQRAAIVTSGAFAILLAAGTIISVVHATRATLAERDATIARNDEAQRRGEAEAARADEQIQRQRADGERDAARAQLYASRAGQIQTAWDADDMDRVRDLLRLQVPGPGEKDLRGFEWYYRARHDRALKSAVRLPDAHIPALSPDGARVVSTVPGEVRAKDGPLLHVWDAATGRRLSAFRPLTRLGRMGDMEHMSAFTGNGNQVLLYGFLDENPRYHPHVVGVWEAAAGKPVFAAEVGVNQFTVGSRFACLSPDGKYFASEAEADDGKLPFVVKVWDTATAKELFARRPGGEPLSDRALRDSHPDSNRSFDGFLAGLAFSPDGTRLAGGIMSASPTDVTVWSVPEGRELVKVGPVGGEVSGIAFSPDGGRLAVARGADRVPGGVEMFDAQTGRNLFRQAIPAAASNRVVFSPDGNRLATAGLGPVATVLDAATGEMLRTLKGYTERMHQGHPISVAFSPDAATLRTIGTDRTVRTWDIRECDHPILFKAKFHARRIVLAEGGARCAASGNERPGQPGDRALKVWDLAGKELLVVPDERAANALIDSHAPLTISRDGRRVAEARQPMSGLTKRSTDKCELQVWDVDSGKAIFRESDDLGFAAVALTRDGRRVAAVDRTLGGPARVWDVETGKLLHTIPGWGGLVRAAAFSPDGRQLACVLADRGKTAGLRVCDLDTESDRVLFAEPAEGELISQACVTFNPDGDRIAWSFDVMGAPADIRVHDAASRRPVVVLDRLPIRVQSVAFSPDGRRLLAAGLTPSSTPVTSNVMTVWDVAAGAAILTLPGGGTGAAFDATGVRLLAPVRYFGSVAVQAWDARP